MSKLPQGEQDLRTLVSLQDWLTLTKLCSGILAYGSTGHIEAPWDLGKGM